MTQEEKDKTNQRIRILYRRVDGLMNWRELLGYPKLSASIKVMCKEIIKLQNRLKEN